jgi:arsenate reductase
VSYKKVYHLANCKTCQKILAQLDLDDSWEVINIKEQNISAADLDYVAEQMGGYEAVFSRRAMKYRSMGLNEMTLTEPDYRKYMLEEYTFLKRPYILYEDKVYVGNKKADVAAAVAHING